MRIAAHALKPRRGQVRGRRVRRSQTWTCGAVTVVLVQAQQRMADEHLYARACQLVLPVDKFAQLFHGLSNPVRLGGKRRLHSTGVVSTLKGFLSSVS